MRFVLARAFTIGLGCAGIAWGAWALPKFWRHAPVETLAQRIMEGEPYRPGALVEQIPALDAIEAEPVCRPSALRSAAIVRFRLAEDALGEGDRPHIDERIAALRRAILASLHCGPLDSFLWLALFWVESASRGFRDDDLKYLRMSYAQGPNEGWIAIRRNRVALAIYSRLPRDMAERVVDEFARILQSDLIVAAADLLTGPGWPIRDILLASTAKVSEPRRARLDRLLRERGYDLKVPGIEPPRPQHRAS